MARNQQAIVQGAPGWVVTYADTMSLLLCCFVLIVAMSGVKTGDRFPAVAASMRRTFGGSDAAAAESMVPATRLVDLLRGLETQVGAHDTGPSGGEGAKVPALRVAEVRDGIEIAIGGTVTFDAFSATLRPEGRELVEKTADLLAGYNTKVLVRGHATGEPLPANSLYDNARDLSYERAKSVATVLEDRGVRPARVAIVALGDTEPLRRQVGAGDRPSADRRVEILVTEDLPDDHAGLTEAKDSKEPSDG